MRNGEITSKIKKKKSKKNVLRAVGAVVSPPWLPLVSPGAPIHRGW